MMVPEVFPVLNYDDIVEPPSLEFEIGEQKTTIGWLKYIFLYYICDDPNCVQIRIEDRQEYNKAVEVFKQINKIPNKTDLLNWEDSATRKEQASALNKLRKHMGYTVEYYEYTSNIRI